MKLVGLMPVRNEAWVLGLSARVALQWCDELMIGLHECSDASAAIVGDIYREFPGRITIATREAGAWEEMRHRQSLLQMAREHCWQATHIALIDADEILTANLVPTIRQSIERLSESIMMLPLYNLRGSMDRYHANGTWGRRIVSVAFKDSPELEWRGDRFHHREPMGRVWRPFQPYGQADGGVLHLWGANERRLAAKHRLYKITERLRWPDKDVREIEQMYSMYDKGALGDDPRRWTFNSVPESWIEPYRELMEKHLHLDAVPWQEAECERLIAEHGRERFAGLSV